MLNIVAHLESKPIKIGLGDTFCCTSCEVSYQVSHVQGVRGCSLNPLLDKNDLKSRISTTGPKIKKTTLFQKWHKVTLRHGVFGKN